MRRTAALRALMQETRLDPAQLIWPLFVRPGAGVREPVGSMPGVFQTSVDECVKDAELAQSLGVGGVILFGIPAHKDATGSSGWDDAGPVQQAVRALKQATSRLLVITDVCMCEYTDHGHCGLLHDGEVDNDASLELLAKEALSHARAGADIVAPSDMMDGRVRARHPRGAGRRGVRPAADSRLRGQVRVRLLRPLSRSRREHTQEWRPARLPDGPRQL